MRIYHIFFVLKVWSNCDESFLDLFEFVDPGENCKNIKFYDSSERLSEAQFPLSSSPVDFLKSGRKPKATAINQLFKDSQSIVSVRIHVERVIQKGKEV